VRRAFANHNVHAAGPEQTICGAAVAELLPMIECIDVMEQTRIEFSHGEAVVPARTTRQQRCAVTTAAGDVRDTTSDRRDAGSIPARRTIPVH